MNDKKAEIRVFLKPCLGGHDLQDDERIFELGFIDSLFAMQLVLFLEKEFQITINDEDLDLGNFETVNAIARFVEHKTAEISGAFP